MCAHNRGGIYWEQLTRKYRCWRMHQTLTEILFCDYACWVIIDLNARSTYTPAVIRVGGNAEWRKFHDEAYCFVYIKLDLMLRLHRRVIGLRPLRSSASGKFRLIATVSPPRTCDPWFAFTWKTHRDVNRDGKTEWTASDHDRSDWSHTSQAGLNGVVTSSAACMRVEVRLG